MSTKYLASKDLTIDGQKIPAGTHLFTVEVDDVPHDRLTAGLQNGAAVTESEYAEIVEAEAERKRQR